MPPQTLISSFQDAMTNQGLLDAWKNAWGIPAPLPDTAALLTGPNNLLTGQLLSSLTLGQLALDAASETPMAGLISAIQDQPGGPIYASWSVNLPVNPNLAYVGVALFNKGSSDLWYVSAFPTLPQAMGNQYTWVVKVALSACLSS